ncbi:hypothetical protein ABL78_1340 [Leptomonas seymouri]|uniref:Uncharacterized protein n=1 Tax=Leptomonas seymouri TaxID=5684 RepID=A0A0N1IAU6_LEPSE|nr:hypothetical protein ABL78_1340 [Leptomonas seymouri]|eukprot:KPI89572.1 hypothetical protein ABL78_1340 [Leptomonas seymouri]
MSAISSFALECARSGRWVRGLMVLQGHTNSTEAATRYACVAVAQVAAAHSWEAALSLLHPLSAVLHTQEVCKTIDTVARHPQLPIEVFEDVVGAMIKALGERERHPTTETVGSPQITPPLALSSASTASTAQIQRRLFLCATQWCSWETAARLLTSLPSPSPRACRERVHALRVLRHGVLHDVGPFAQWADAEGDGGHAHSQNTVCSSPPSASDGAVESMGEKLQRLEVVSAGAPHRRYSARDRRELARLRELKRRTLLQRALSEEAVLVQQAFTEVAPSAASVCAALRVLSRPRSAITCTNSSDALSKLEAILTLVQSSRLTPELALLYARAMGVLYPQNWAEALAVLGRVEARADDTGLLTSSLQKQANLWLMSRGSWAAALNELSHWPRSSTAATSMQMAEDTVRLTALPTHLFHRMYPQHARPWYRLSAHQNEPVARQIATALARGLRLDEVQLSVAGKQWAAQGRWEDALQLYYRFPLSEFQKYAARSLVKARPALPEKALAGEPGGKSTTNAPETGSGGAHVLDVMAALRLLVPEGGIRYTQESPPRPAPPLDVFPASLLIDAAPDWEVALAVFRGCIRSGTRCNPRLLSALLHHTDFPLSALRQVLASYPAAVSDGMRRRVKESYGVELP